MYQTPLRNFQPIRKISSASNRCLDTDLSLFCKSHLFYWIQKPRNSSVVLDTVVYWRFGIYGIDSHTTAIDCSLEVYGCEYVTGLYWQRSAYMTHMARWKLFQLHHVIDYLSCPSPAQPKYSQKISNDPRFQGLLNLTMDPVLLEMFPPAQTKFNHVFHLPAMSDRAPSSAFPWESWGLFWQHEKHQVSTDIIKHVTWHQLSQDMSYIHSQISVGCRRRRPGRKDG